MAFQQSSLFFSGKKKSIPTLKMQIIYTEWLQRSEGEPSVANCRPHPTPDLVSSEVSTPHARALQKLLGEALFACFALCTVSFHWTRNMVVFCVCFGRGNQQKCSIGSNKAYCSTLVRTARKGPWLKDANDPPRIPLSPSKALSILSKILQKDWWKAYWHQHRRTKPDPAP